MRKYKISNFLRDNPGGQFPPHRPLEDDERRSICQSLGSKLGLPEQTPALEVLLELRSRWRPVGSGQQVSAAMLARELVALLGELGNGHVFLNWRRFDDMDEMQLGDFVRHIDDIWYPGADDLEVFDKQLAWVLAVSHEGELFFSFL